MSFPCSTLQNLEGILVAHWKGNTALKWGRNILWQGERGKEFFGGRAQKK